MSDKFIFIKRAVPFVHDQINSEVMQEQLAMTKRSVGSYFASKNSPKLGTGLSPTEEDFLVPIILSMKKDNPEYSKVFREFYTNINTIIPGGPTGLKLNIGLVDNTKAVAADNLPEDINSYIRFRHILGYPNTAVSPEAAKGNPLIEYYVEDPDKVVDNKTKDLEVRDRAMAEYMKAKEDDKRVTMIVSVMKTYIKKEAGKPPVNIATATPKEKLIILRDLAISRPEKFYELATDQNLNKKYMIEELLSVGILSRVGNSIVDVEDNSRAIGNTVQEVVNFLWNPNEAMRLNRFKADYDRKKSGNKVLA